MCNIHTYYTTLIITCLYTLKFSNSDQQVILETNINHT